MARYRKKCCVIKNFDSAHFVLFKKWLVMCSLPNKSDIIRWSLDLRWQNPKMDNGFYGLKKSVLMRTSEEPDLKIDWTEMAGIDRTKKQMAETVSCVTTYQNRLSSYKFTFRCTNISSYVQILPNNLDFSSYGSDQCILEKRLSNDFKLHYTRSKQLHYFGKFS